MKKLFKIILILVVIVVVIFVISSLTKEKPQGEIGDEVKVSSDWGAPQRLPSPISSQAWEDGPFISSDGKTLYFTRGKDLNVDIYVSKKTADGWSQPESLDINLKGFPTGAPFLTQGGKTLYFASVRPGSIGSADIYVVKNENGKWGQSENLGQPINTEYLETDPVLSPDGQILYFASNRPGGKGEGDIWMAKKTANGWSEPVNLGTPTNSEKDENQEFITQDGKELYFMATNRKGIGGPAIFRSMKEGDKWGEPEVVVSGFVGEPSLISDKQFLYFVHIIRKGGKLIDAEIMFSKHK